MGKDRADNIWVRLRRYFQKIGWLVFSACFALMTVQSSGIASFNNIEYNIIITPDHFPIIWPKDDGTGAPVDYGQGSSLSASELLNANVCLASANCSVDAISAGAVYYKVVNIAGVGDVIFYYDELGKLVGTQRKSEVSYNSSDAVNSNSENTAASYNDPDDYFGDYSAYAVGATSASFNVAPSGSANYEIPIYTPPGIGDLQPELSIKYNSQAGNGLLGVGFNLSGLSAITRCARTRATDGISRVSEPPDYDNSDAFCLDGQRLILVAGTNGTNGAEYRTEVEGFSRITVTDGNSDTPLSFQAETKAGQTLKYGVSDNSRIYLTGHQSDTSQNNKTVSIWAVEEIEDVAGNTIHFDYQKETSSIEYRPLKVSYGASGYEASIEFNYGSRSDSRTGYIKGSKRTLSQRMTDIQVKVAGNQARYYGFSYGANNAGKSRIESIQECGTSTASSDCFAPVGFEWSGNNQKSFVGYAKKISNFGADHSEWESNYPRMMADVNGDGLADVVGFGKKGVYVSESTGTGFRAPELRKADYGYNQGWRVDQHPRMMADVDGDGRADVVGFYNDGVYVSLSTGTGFGTKSRWVATHGYSAGGWRVDKHPRMLADVNGDGLADVVGFADNGVLVSLSTGTSFQNSGIWMGNYGNDAGWSYANHPRMLRDVNGDGLADIVGFGGAGVYVSLSTGTGFQGMSLWHSDFGYHDGYRGATHPRMVSDVNGDGLADLVVIAGNGVWIALSTGTKFLSRSRWVAQYGADYGWQGGQTGGQHPRMLADINGDRIPDMVGFYNAGVEASLSTGSGLESSTRWIGSFGSNAGWGASHPRELADINGDGIDDIIGFANDGVYTATSANDSGKPRITTITNGPKPPTSIDYAYLTQDSDVYSKGADVITASEKTIAVPMSVVKSISIDNGIGGYNKKTYRYEDLRYNRDGRGTRGFKQFEVTDHTHKIRTTRQFKRTHPYKGQLSQMSRELFDSVNADNSLNNPSPIETVTKSYEDFVSPLSPQVRRIVNNVATRVNHLTNVTATTNITSTDDYGNVESSLVVTTGHGQTHSKSITSTYHPANVADWIIDSLNTAEVVHHFDGPSADPSNTDITRSSSFTYDDKGRLQTETIEPNASDLTLQKTTTYEYDASYGYVSKITTAGWDTEDNALTRSVTIGRVGDSYNGQLAVKQTTTNAQSESESVWTSLINGGQVSHIGPNQKQSTAIYDALGRKTSATDALGVTTLTTHNWTAAEPLNSIYAITQHTQGLEDKTTSYHDSLGRVIQMKNKSLDGRDVINQTIYNAKGLKEKISRPYLAYTDPVWICFSHDAYGRTTGKDSPGAMNGSPDCYSGNRASSSTAYDGLTITSTDELGQVKIETQNLPGQVARIDEAHATTDHSWLTYTYDATGNLKTVTDAVGKVTALDYDNNGRKRKINDPAMGEWLYAYNSFGELGKQTDAKSQTIEIAYDTLGRMQQRIDGEGSWNWTYATTGDATHPVGKLKSVSGPNAYLKQYSYNADLLPESTTETQTLPDNTSSVLTQTVSYDELGRVDRQYFPNGFE
ncbi:MAG: hypothetical protein GY820_48185, partial [Gammaproteobacteria bacterium]|nr:hypothetical protein [Gammaproteobacteria bacterium]